MGGIGGSRPAKVLGDDFARDDADDRQISGGQLLRRDRRNAEGLVRAAGKAGLHRGRVKG